MNTAHHRGIDYPLCDAAGQLQPATYASMTARSCRSRTILRSQREPLPSTAALCTSSYIGIGHTLLSSCSCGCACHSQPYGNRCVSWLSPVQTAVASQCMHVCMHALADVLLLRSLIECSKGHRRMHKGLVMDDIACQSGCQSRHNHISHLWTAGAILWLWHCNKGAGNACTRARRAHCLVLSSSLAQFALGAVLCAAVSTGTCRCLGLLNGGHQISARLWRLQ